ncbi:glycoside hydrolase family 65 protein [Ornithinibacillus californiensis]|uniref:glycoside hydrolase family 65 protein n=1 Tax=Ornithinibacillus californiensis TaxID=161536 RepID=UPI00064DF307|nr:glycosyl hydrolase family 65 protein [Ornithinibacillus californiensis]
MSWKVKSNAFDLDTLLVEESLFFNGNGYIGIRGNLEEGLPPHAKTVQGSYINGFHDIVEIPYGEKLYGFPENQQKLLNIIDAQRLEIWVGKNGEREKVSLFSGEILHYERILHLDQGITERVLHWRSSQGIEIKINFVRLVSFKTRELFQQYVTLTPLSENIPIQIISHVNGDVQNFADQSDPRVASGDSKRLKINNLAWIKDSSYVEVEAHTSKLRAAMLSHVKISASNASNEYKLSETSIQTVINFTLTQETFIDKRTFIGDSSRYEDLQKSLVSIKETVSHLPYEQLLNLQKEYVSSFWKNTDVLIDGDEYIQEAIRFNLYHLLQSAGQDGKTSIAAKGLSGEGYEGHYFWDTEIYLLPMFTLTNPKLARKLLYYRYSILDYARKRALEMGHSKGALYPWRTITGTECSSYYPAGTAQYHISADIAYSFIQYYLATDDIDFLKEFGAEVVIETARLWLEVGHYQGGYFKIDTVTGPDEYTAIVNNNYYTNVMAKYNLNWAIKVYQILQKEDPKYWQQLTDKISISTSELAAMEKAATTMYLPINQDLNINPQDDTFLQKEIWDFEGTPDDAYPLLLHYHPLTIYRYQVCKQADTVLAHFLVEDEQSEDIIKDSYDYYEKITTHDSSLSSCVFSMMGAKVGYIEKAYDYFLETARLDLDNLHGNTKDGLHMANMGGTWLAIVAGFGGLRLKENGLYFRPQLPKAWNGYSFHIQYKGRLLLITNNHDGFKVELLSGESINLYIWGKEYTVTNNSAVLLA